jgi:hypothetical protein
MCSIRISSLRIVMEKLKGHGNMKPWFLFTAQLDAGVLILGYITYRDLCVGRGNTCKFVADD